MDIKIANYVRIFTIIVSGLSLAYGLMMLGHVLGWGGLETMREPNISLVFVILGFLACGSFCGSRFIDRTIYKSVAKYEETLYLSDKQIKDKIRKQERIKKRDESKAIGLERALKRNKGKLEQATEEQYKQSQKASTLAKTLASTQKSVKNVVASIQQNKEEIETTEEQIKADVALIDLLNEDLNQLDTKLETVKKEHLEIQKILQPLTETRNLKKRTLNLRKEEYQNCVESIANSKKEIKAITSELNKLKKKSEKARKEESTLAENHEQMSQDLTSKEADLKLLRTQIKKYESMIEEYNIAELSEEKEKEVLEKLKKRTEEHFNQEQKGDDKIFTN
ncbi:MAG: hypothetical protein ACJZ40_01535 [Candidatus Poseidoniaceae archaeon]